MLRVSGACGVGLCTAVPLATRPADVGLVETFAQVAALAAALLAPRPAFLRARRDLGEDLRAVAERFTMTQTGVALRRGEVLGTPLAVIAPARVRVRGPEAWVWPPESTLRAWARRPLAGLKKTRLTDDPRRVVLEADDLAGDAAVS